MKQDTQTKQQTPQFLRKRKFLLVLPVIIFPFATFLLWSIGIVGPSKATAQNPKQIAGLNMTLPDAKIQEKKHWDKLSFYEQADKDSAKYKEAMRNDPYYSARLSSLSAATDTGIFGKSHSYRNIYDPAPPLMQNESPNEKKIFEKLALLNTALNKQDTNSQHPALKDTPAKNSAATSENMDIDRLENMLQAINQKSDTADPEMNNIKGVLQNIFDIQHPELIQEKIKQQSLKHQQEVLPVVLPGGNNVSLLQGRQGLHSQVAGDSVRPVYMQHNGFFSLENDNSSGSQQNTIEAVINEDQTLVNGSTVKLRLINDVYIGGVLVPKETFVYGAVALNGERLLVNIKSIRYRNSILPVALSVFDLDGMEGVYIPGAITRDVAKQSTDQGLQQMGLTSVDPSIGAQAASAGIEAAKTLLSKKVKLIRVNVKAGYRILLKDNNAVKQ